MERQVKSRRDSAGMALLTALGLLIFFVVIGTAMVQYMKIEHDVAKLETESARARLLARAGVEATVGELESALKQGTISEFLQKEHTFEFPSYVVAAPGTADAQALAQDENYRGRATVVVMDECAKINLNYAPTAVLMRALNISGEKARKIRQSLPVAGQSSSDRRWFANVDELATRGFLTKKEWASVNKDILTVDSVQDPAKPIGFVNVNTASAEALQAVLGVTPEEAQSIIAARPLSNVGQLSAAAGKDPAAFVVKPEPEEPNALPQELAFTSSCYRIVSNGAVIRTTEPGQEETRTTKSIETVVVVGAAPAL